MGDCDSECGSGEGRERQAATHRQNNHDMVKSGSVTDWMRYQVDNSPLHHWSHSVVSPQPRSVKRSSSNILINHKMTEQDRVEETALLNNIS